MLPTSVNCKNHPLASLQRGVSVSILSETEASSVR